jgi:hypothetical protein
VLELRLAGAQVEHLQTEFRVSQQHLLRVKGVTSVSGLDVLAANCKVKEQCATITALRQEVWPCSLLFAPRVHLPVYHSAACWLQARQY